MSDQYLVGKTLTGVKIASDKGALLFETTDGKAVVRADGDCCSHTWIEHIELPALGFPAKVLAVDDLPMPDLGSPDKYDVIAYYGCKITTDRGEMVIDFRNSSNGYYGGSLVWPKLTDDEYNHFYGGVYGQNVSNEDWREVSESSSSTELPR